MRTANASRARHTWRSRIATGAQVGLLTALVVFAAERVGRTDEPRPAGAATVTWSEHVAPVLRKYCVACHSGREPQGKLSLETHAGLAKGGENGTVVVAGKVAESRLIGVLEGRDEPAMPPKGKPGPSPAEIALLKSWIASGARAPRAEDDVPLTAELVVPKIAPTGPVRRAIPAAAVSPDGKTIALGRYGRVELVEAKSRAVRKVLEGPPGPVNAVGFSKDGGTLFAAGGEPGRFGEAATWSVPDGKPLRKFRGQRDALLAAALDPAGRVLATGSYDQSIRLWDARDGRLLHEISGHNGPVFDLAFDPAGRLLASASGDRTVKLWDVARGERLDTFGQPEKEQQAVVFSPDGRWLVAGGADNRIRAWEIREGGKEGASPLVYARFAHESSLLRLAFSPDGSRLVSSAEDRLLKVWRTSDFVQVGATERQSDWTTGLAFVPGTDAVLAARMDGTWDLVSLTGIAPGSPSAGSGGVPVPIDAARTHALEVPGRYEGTIDKSGVSDFVRFESEAGGVWVIETQAASAKSPLDTRIDVLDAAGRPVVRTLLQAVRDSYVTFRPIDSTSPDVRVKNWEEMRLNELLYVGGEVVKIFRLPQGPDSGFQLWQNAGKRRCWFDTSPTIHALDDPLYVVEPHPPGTVLVDNGLPVFPVHYANDDDAERELGSDSRLTFRAPAQGTYFVRVADVRGFGGKDFKYGLTIRRPAPDFAVRMEPATVTIPAGGGQSVKFVVDRKDGFDGDVRIDVADLPAGLGAASPIVIQAGHLEAKGVFFVDAEMQEIPAEAVKRAKITARGTIGGEERTHDVAGLGEVKLGKPPKVRIALEPDRASGAATSGDGEEIVLVPGTTITALLRLERLAGDGDVRCDVENLPHGVIVDNLGLNGITVRAGQTAWKIFLTAEDWVAPQERLVHATAKSEGNPASRPIRLRIAPR